MDEIISSSKEEMGKAIEKLRQDNELRIKSLTGAAFLAYSPSSHAVVYLAHLFQPLASSLCCWH